MASITRLQLLGRSLSRVTQASPQANYQPFCWRFVKRFPPLRSYTTCATPKQTPTGSQEQGNGTKNDATERLPLTPPHTSGNDKPRQVEGDIEAWTIDEVVEWAKGIRGVRPEDAEVLRGQAVEGSALLSLTEDKLMKLGFPYGPAASLVIAVEKLKKTAEVAKPSVVTPTYYIVPLDGGLRGRLKDPDNCLLYKMGHDAPHYVHVGVKRVAEVIDSFVNQPPDATQRKNLILVVGSPKSGKTSEAMVVVPHLLEAHISKVVVKEGALLPCHKVYIDCASLVAINTSTKKIWSFYKLVADAMNVAVPMDINTSNVDMFEVKKLFRSATHYTIVTIDEYQMLLANLSQIDKADIANNLRDIMLDASSACQFIITGSTGAALMSSLEESIQNGISVFKAAGVVCTDLRSTENDLADVQTLLAHYNRAPSGSPSSAIQSGLGFVNCAAANVVSVLIKKDEDANPTHKCADQVKERVKRAVKDYAGRVLNIYHRDYEAVLKHNNTLLKRIHQMIHGIHIQPVGAWLTFVDEVALKNGSHVYLWREPLFAVYMALQTVLADDGTVVWRRDYVIDFPVYDAVLLVRLIPVVEGKMAIDATSFNAWYGKWDKDETKYNDVVSFLCERQVIYWQKRQKAHPNDKTAQAKAALTSSDWAKDGNWLSQIKQPLELLRLIRNATVPHEDSIEGRAIKEGGHAFITYFGKGDRARATQFIKEAQTFIV